LQLVEQLGLKDFLDRTIPGGREEIPWSLMALVLILCRLCEPSSELHIAEHFYAQSALADLLGISPDKINEQRLYRALDAILPHKALKVLEESVGRVVRHRVRPAAVRRDQHVFRGPSQW
jgi:DNA-binding transcriptional regulator YdaS (Cro superfamily)